MSVEYAQSTDSKVLMERDAERRGEARIAQIAKALHTAGIGCKPNIPGCRSTHRGHAARLEPWLP